MRPLYANWITKYVKVREKRNSGRNMQRPLIDNLAQGFNKATKYKTKARASKAKATNICPRPGRGQDQNGHQD